VSNELSRWELIDWFQEVMYRRCVLLSDRRTFDRNEFDVLVDHCDALLDELQERNRHDPIHEHTCERCGEAPAALWWLSTRERLCAGCWSREREIEESSSA